MLSLHPAKAKDKAVVIDGSDLTVNISPHAIGRYTFAMLIALVGPACAGKLEVAKYLVVHHDFRPAFVVDDRQGRLSASAEHESFASSSSSAPEIDADTLRRAHRWTELVSLVCPNEPRSVLEGKALDETNAAGAMLSTLMPDGTPLAFRNKTALLDHSTFHWRDNIVTLDLTSRTDVELGFDKRPFFLLIGIDAPVYTRWTRELAR